MCSRLSPAYLALSHGAPVSSRPAIHTSTLLHQLSVSQRKQQRATGTTMKIEVDV